jgi:hypothetical protein
MKCFTAADLGMLAQGRSVDAAVFLAILTDAEAVGELARLLQARDLLEVREEEDEEPGLTNLPEMHVSWDDLAAYGERVPLPPERRHAVERFLGRHFPEALADPAETDTVRFGAEEDTDVSRPTEVDPYRHRPPGNESKQC